MKIDKQVIDLVLPGLTQNENYQDVTGVSIDSRTTKPGDMFFAVVNP